MDLSGDTEAEISDRTTADMALREPVTKYGGKREPEATVDVEAKEQARLDAMNEVNSTIVEAAKLKASSKTSYHFDQIFQKHQIFLKFHWIMFQQLGNLSVD